MSLENAPEGSIIIDTYPVSRESNRRYVFQSGNDVISVAVHPKLEPYIEASFRAEESGYRVYWPVVVGREGKGDLLARPNIQTTSKVFAPGLVVPELSMKKRLGGPASTRYHLQTPYSLGQIFYVNPLLITDENVVFQGILFDESPEEYAPRVGLIRNSKDDEGVRGNKEELEELTNRLIKDVFWWELKRKHLSPQYDWVEGELK